MYLFVQRFLHSIDQRVSGIPISRHERFLRIAPYAELIRVEYKLPFGTIRYCSWCPTQSQFAQNPQTRLGLVEGVKMQTRCAQLYQALAQLRHHVLSECFDGLGIVAETGEFE